MSVQWAQLSALQFADSLTPSDTNWHTMLYLIRCTFAIADQSSKAWSTDAEADFAAQPSTEGAELLVETRALFRGLADNNEKAKVERGFLLGLLEIARESRRRKWEEGESYSRGV